MKPKRKPEARYESIRENASAHNLEASRKGRDIGPPPEIVDRARRDEGFRSLRRFLKIYFPQTFRFGWSADHLAVIEQQQRVIEGGGQYALAMPRGGGKSSISERAALWAVLTGRRRFVVVVSANEGLAVRSLDKLKVELERNELLLADWPKAIHAIRRLESQSRRCTGQLCEGKRTYIGWERNRITLPTMDGPDNEASGAVIHVVGLGGAIRGLGLIDPDGRTIRPDLLLIDDPQDRESASSAVQTADRLATINGDLLGLAGFDQPIAAVATVTVIRRDDLADQLLDAKRSPSWQGARYRLISRWPDQIDLWEEYLKLRAEGLLPGGDRGEEATEFYRQHRSAMDAGSEVSWPERHNPGQLSGLQYAYDLRQDIKEHAFEAEYQNNPPDHGRDIDGLDALSVAQRGNGFERGLAPPEAEKLTAFIDVGAGLLWWAVCGWSERFDGYLLDYGCWPRQRARIFASRNADPNLSTQYPSAGGSDGAIHAGLTDLVKSIVERPWARSDGAGLSVSRILVDAGWATDLVRLFIRQNQSWAPLTPSKGFALSPAQTAISEYRKRPGEKIGHGWILGVAGPDRLRLLRFETGLWKTQVADMLARSMGEKGGLSLFGSRPIEHELLSMHLTAEYPTRVEAKGAAVNVWTKRPDRENHLWDCLVGCAVGASLEGLSPHATIGGSAAATPARKRMTFDELRRQRRGD